ncbi:MAG: thiol-disulfide isomerase/thioredoxin [Planctomycetota bacterium]|jgi:thiol-disulfide isomerase/thioredoxin
MPHLKELVEHHKDDPFALIGINVGDSPEDYRKGVKEFEVSWLSAFEGQGGSAIASLYAVKGYPTYLVLDVDGKIVHRGHNPNAIDQVVADLVAKAKK